MAEYTPNVRGIDKHEAYATVLEQAAAILADTDDVITAMATMSCLLYQGFGFLWAGFYRTITPALLRVGPYQGTLGCLEIAVGRGVCGAAAQSKRTIIVPDVTAFPGHIACDSRSRSEIVVPVFDRAGALIAVLDIDSAELAAFDETDAKALESLVGWFAM